MFSLILLLMASQSVSARQLKVGKGWDFKNVQEAALYVKPGDTILVKMGTYATTEFINNMKGTSETWITIKAELTGKTIYTLGSQAFHFLDPEYIKIEGFVFTGQTGNGVNIDDSGSPESPAHHLIIENCEWRDIGATGNNDELKISGLEDFVIKNCRFLNGSKGGSMIDMVGCHRGIIEDNLFENGGSNSIQAKGGTEDLIIRRNSFKEGGERAINIGGSTGLQYFRPLGTPFEASGIKVWSNIFVGGTVPVAFVGAVNCEVVNNTMINPGKWVVRILQENNSTGMQYCGKNIFRNNIIVFPCNNKTAINIGPNTSPGSFIFSNNLWFNPEDTSWGGPQTPVTETGQILNAEPQFSDNQYRLKATSPAIGKGYPVQMPESDYFGKHFASKRVIGAIEF